MIPSSSLIETSSSSSSSSSTTGRRFSSSVLAIAVFVWAAGVQSMPHAPSWTRNPNLQPLELEVALAPNSGGLKKAMALDCTACKLGVRVLQEAVKLNASGDELIKLGTEICIKLNIEDERVCAGAVSAYSLLYLPLIRDYVITPDEICGIFFGEKCGSPFDPFVEWSVKFPTVEKPPVKKPVRPNPKAPRSKVLHLTDIHMDLSYSPGSNADCGEPLCCRSDDGKPKTPGDKAGYWGDYRYCDLPMWTLADMLKHINKTEKFDYILWTGDVVAHDVWKQSKKNQLLYENTITRVLTESFPHTPIFPTLGNHEGYPVNSFPLPTGADSPHPNKWLYDDIARTWTQSWLPADVKTTVERGAFYTALAGPGLRIISLNSNYCHRMNWWIFVNSTDPLGMLQWFVDTLQAAEDAGEKVQVIGHIPPGENDCLPMWSRNYRAIVNRYESTIVGQFYGHTHNDHFEVFYDGTPAEKRPTNVLYIAPAVTTYKFMNAAYRVYHTDGPYENSSRQILDMDTYYLNITDTNLSNRPVWQLEYTATEAYKMKSLYPEDWDDFIDRMEEDDELFTKFYHHYYKSHPHGNCDQSCKWESLCALRTAQSYEPVYCPAEWKLSPLRYLRSFFETSNC